MGSTFGASPVVSQWWKCGSKNCNERKRKRKVEARSECGRQEQKYMQYKKKARSESQTAREEKVRKTYKEKEEAEKEKLERTERECEGLRAEDGA